jgi:flagellar export protein FliJ
VKRFAFRLERVRELRERAERAQAAELGAAMRAEQERGQALGQARRALEIADEQAGAAPVDRSVAAGSLRNLDLARDAAARQVSAAGDRLREARARTGAEQEKYGEKRRDLRVVERLKEKRLETWREEVSRDEQKTIDGVALRRHNAGDPTS